MIGFDRPWLLLGIAAALLPLWMHLRGRRAVQTVAFSALAFLHRRHPERARAQRLRERALLAARMLVMAGLAFALAGPLVPGCDESSSALSDEPMALVVVLDDSLSMQATIGGGPSQFSLARQRALSLLERLPAGSRAMVVTSAKPARAILPRLESDLRSLQGDVAALNARASADDANAALALAARLLAHATEADRRIVVLSDLQASGWSAVQAGALGGLRVDAEPLGSAWTNTAILAADVTPAPERGAHQVRLKVELGHDGPGPFTGPLVVRVGGRELRRRLEIPAGERRTVELPLAALAPVAEIELPGGDDLAGDDRRLVRLGAGSALRVALINGAPRPVPRDDEVYFLRRALDVSNGAELDVQTLQLAELNPEKLASYDVLWIANVAEFAPPVLAALVARIEAGTGVVVSLGDESDGAARLGWLAGLLPDHWLAKQPGGALAGVLTETLGPDADRAALELSQMLEGVDVGLGDTTVQRRIGTAPLPDLDRHVAMRFADGAPALLAWTRGRGRLLVWTTSVDLDWTDAPLQPGFVPLVSLIVRNAAGAAMGRPRAALQPGEGFELARSDAATRLEVHLPDGRVAVSLDAEQQPSRRWRVPGLTPVGSFQAVEFTAAGPQPPVDLVVVPPPSESAPERLKALPLPTRPASTKANAARQVPQLPVAPLALSLLLLVLLGEAVLLLADLRSAKVVPR